MEDEEIITTDVPETSEEELEEVDVDTSENVETEETQERDIDKEIEERANQLFEEKVKDRLDRYKKSEEKNLRKYKYLENIVKAGTGTNNLDDAINETVNFYRGNDIEIPEFNNYSEDDEKVLGRSDAKSFMDLDYKEIEAEADRLADIPREQRTVREQEKLFILGTELKKRNNIEAMKAKGYDTNVLETKEFKDFSNQFNNDIDISKVYEMYEKVKGLTPKKPSSPGSAKNNNSGTEVKEYYTPDEARQFTEEDLEKNPKLMEAIEKSMQQWGKYK